LVGELPDAGPAFCGSDGLLDRRAADAVLVAAGQIGLDMRCAASAALSAREIGVLRLVAREVTNAAIAMELRI
jgi:FixJ family two-component response regulator